MPFLLQLITLCLALGSFSPSVAANIYALVIGIDQYTPPIHNLAGAVNDAKMIAQALKAVGVEEVTLLTNTEASRDAIYQAWQAMVAKAEAGDTVIFTYAGHGAQHPERVKGTEVDGKDEFFVLSGFSEQGANTYERIIDDDLQAWFSAVPQLNIVLVSDSCHSGTMTRKYNSSHLKYRRVDVGPLQQDALPIAQNATVVNESKTPLKHVASFAGVADHKEVPEIHIENQVHGALSWYFSKGVLGNADSNHDLILEANELKSFLETKVVLQTDGQQHPVITIPAPLTLAKLSQQTQAQPAVLQSVNLGLAADPSSRAIAAKLMHTRAVSPDAATLTLDLKQHRLLNQFDDTVYSFSPELEKNLPVLQQVVDKYLLIENLKQLTDITLQLGLSPDDSLHSDGDKLVLWLKNIRYPYFTLFNIAADGTLNFLYPQSGDKLTLDQNQPFALDLEVTPPFGADHFIALTSATPLTQLHTRLLQMDNHAGDYALLFKQLQQLLATTPHQLGLHSTYTRP